MHKPTGYPIGRPTLFNTPASDRITVSVTPAQYHELQRVASALDVPASRVIRDAINRFTDDYGARRLFVRTRSWAGRGWSRGAPRIR